MRSWFSSKSTVISVTIQTNKGNLPNKIKIQSDETVKNLKAVINEQFNCNPDLQKLIFHGQELEDEKLLSAYNIMNESIILLFNRQDEKNLQRNNQLPISKKRKSLFAKHNPYYQKQENESLPEKQNDDNGNNKYFDPVLRKLAEYHPELPLAVVNHSKDIGDLMKDLNRTMNKESSGDTEQKLNDDQQQSLAEYYYYLSLASLSAVTTSVASSVYQHLPSKESISTSVQSIIKRPTSADSNANTDKPTKESSGISMSWITHLQKLMRDTKAEKAAIDRLVSLGFNKRDSVEAYLACDKDEALAALFMSQNMETKGSADEKKEDNDNESVDASVGYKSPSNELMDNENDKTILYKSVYFDQFQTWLRSVFIDDELYYRYLLMFMKEKIADLSALEDINYDEQYLVDIGMSHKIHRKRLIKAIGTFVQNKNKFELWWNDTIAFKKYLLLFKKNGIWDLEELLLQIRSTNDIKNKIKIQNEDDIKSIWKHVQNLRNEHSLYTGIKRPGSVSDSSAYNPIYSAPPLPMQMYPNLDSEEPCAPSTSTNVSIDQDTSVMQKEGAITQM